MDGNGQAVALFGLHNETFSKPCIKPCDPNLQTLELVLPATNVYNKKVFSICSSPTANILV